MDVVTANVNGASVSVSRNTSVGSTISFATKTDFTPGSVPISVAVRDIDGDGKTDLIVSNYNAGTISVLRNISSGIGNINFAPRWIMLSVPNLTTPGRPTSTETVKPDIAVANLSSNTVSVLLNTSTPGTLSFAAKVDLARWDQAQESFLIGDLDGGWKG